MTTTGFSEIVKEWKDFNISKAIFQPFHWASQEPVWEFRKHLRGPGVYFLITRRAWSMFCLRTPKEQNPTAFLGKDLGGKYKIERKNNTFI